MIVGPYDLEGKFLAECIDLLRAGVKERGRARHSRRLEAIIVDQDDMDRYDVHGW